MEHSLILRMLHSPSILPYLSTTLRNTCRCRHSSSHRPKPNPNYKYHLLILYNHKTQILHLTPLLMLHYHNCSLKMAICNKVSTRPDRSLNIHGTRRCPNLVSCLPITNRSPVRLRSSLPPCSSHSHFHHHRVERAHSSMELFLSLGGGTFHPYSLDSQIL